MRYPHAVAVVLSTPLVAAAMAGCSSSPAASQ
jgi:hypothetical protein